MSAILWTGLRQIEALRDSLVWNLIGRSVQLDHAYVQEWLRKQGLDPIEVICHGPTGDRLESPGTSIAAAIDARFASTFGTELGSLALGSDSPDPRLDHFPETRSGAGWQNAAHFVITSAFARLLGSSEQFEMDVLKSLFYYRPSGRVVGDENLKPIEVETDVFLEQPDIDGEKRVFHKPPLWTWIRKQAENNVERDKIFSNVFGIKTVAPDCSTKRKAEWYEKRNAIVHGRSGVDLTLGEYIEVEVFVAKSLRYVADQCREKLGVSI